MAYKVLIQQSALKELESIIAFLVAKSPRSAELFALQWEEALENLKSGLVEYQLCHEATLARLGYHFIVMQDHVVLYLKNKGTIEIAHLFHQSQDYAQLVLNGG